ncbi:MAG TPA: haloacid dehalogenase type II [Burkholderiales bacterium]|nr:haloacid dehalogenase type II [Burkholderiales bacterium]
MAFNRRAFLNLVAGATATSVLGSTLGARAATKKKISAIAFDAFTTFDPRPVFALADQLFPGRGAELSNAWRVRQFEYQWLRALSGRYADFRQATEEALVFAANLLKLDLSAEKRDRLMEAYLELKAWPDAAPALRSLREQGVRLALLSNATRPMLEAWIDRSGLESTYEYVLSTDEIKTYKPDPRAYRMAVEAFGLTIDDIAFAAFGGWDVAGAKWFGYTTFWVNRLNLPVEQLGVTPDGMGASLTELVPFVQASS